MVANVDDQTFDIEVALRRQVGLLPLPFPGMDKSSAAVCRLQSRKEANNNEVDDECPLGSDWCPLKHISGEKKTVCKHWLRGLCRKGDYCEYLHQYDMEKMPECFFYTQFSA